MSNPTLEAAWNEYAERSGLTIEGVACSPAKAQSAYFAFEAGWNRRAQPEGEAPQADGTVRLDWLQRQCFDVLYPGSEWATWQARGGRMGEIGKDGHLSFRAAIDAAMGITPAAQQAESGAQAAGVKGWEQRKAEAAAAGHTVWPDMYYANCEIGDLRGRLAAQSQGAQATNFTACPYCQCEDTGIVSVVVGRKAVACAGCGMVGPSRETVDEARIAWSALAAQASANVDASPKPDK